MDGPAARRSADPDSKDRKRWLISLAIVSNGSDDDFSYAVEGVAMDSLARPWTKLKPERGAVVDEEQDTGGQPGWWFLLAGRGFRPLPTTPRNATFPAQGKRRLTLELLYGKQSVMQVQGFFDFDERGPPASAKIHVDRKYSQAPSVGSMPSSLSSQSSTPASTDYLFLRTTDWYLTAIRLFVPYSVLARDGLRLGSWLSPKRVRDMHASIPGFTDERQHKRQKRELPVKKNTAPSGEDSIDSVTKRTTRPWKVIELSSSSSGDDGSDFDDGEPINRTRARSGRTRREVDDEFEWRSDEDDEEDEDDKQSSKMKKPTAPSARATTRTATSSTTSTTSSTTTTSTTTTRATGPRPRATTSKDPLWDDRPLATRPRGAFKAEDEDDEPRGQMVLDDGEVSLGSEFDPDLDFDLKPLALGAGPGTNGGRARKEKDRMEPGEESVVAPPPPAAAARRRGRRAVQVVDVDEDDSEIDVDNDDADDDEEEDVLLAPAKPTDLFVWHSQSQGMSQCGSQLTEVEEIDSSQFVLQPKDVIGSGSFARVYRANYKGLDVAVKVFKPSELPTRIDNEVRILGKLRGHENVVRVVGYCVVGDQKQIAMEYCAYGNLHECIQNVKRNAGGRGLGRAARRKTEKGRELEAAMRSTRRSRGAPATPLSKRKRDEVEAPTSPPDPYEAIKQRRGAIIAGIARGMQHLHKNNVCHRDLSSMNVLVDSNWVPKIADFGLSTVDVNEMKGMGVGTGRWRAPEVFKNKPKNCQDKFKGFYTNSSDVYSFGVIVWELFHLGQVPWEGELDADVKRKVMQGDRPKIERDVPKVWRKLMEQCWAHDPDSRPSFANVVRYLEARHLA